MHLSFKSIIMKVTLSFILIILLTVFASQQCIAKESTTGELPPSTPLTRAIRLEKINEISELISGETVRIPDGGGYHPLSYAAYTGNNKVMEALLKAGADPNVVEANGKTALYITANQANVEGIKLLHTYNTTLPPATALSPAKAAVHSGSVECLTALLNDYPDIDLHAGWNNRDDKGNIIEDSPGDPISYAAYHGYNDIALFLLTKKVKPDGMDYLRKTALHHAAINPNCTPELVKALIDAGNSPIQKANPPLIYWPHLSSIPRTPLDYSALSGDMAKLKLLVLTLDPKINRNEIWHAAHLAAAYDMDMSYQYLLSLIGEKLTSYPEFLGHNEVNLDEPNNATPEIRAEELGRIMPRTKARPGTLPGEGTIAVVSDPKLKNQAALLSVALSKKQGIELVERDELDALVVENSLRSLNDGSSDALHQTLDLIPARTVVILANERIGEKSFVRASVIDTSSGLIVASHALPVKSLEIMEGSNDMADAVSFAIGNQGKSGIAVSITPIAPDTLEAQAATMARNINVLQSHFASNTQGVSLLNRAQIQYLQREKAIGVEGSYWAAAWVVDGGFSSIKDGEAKLTLRAIHAINKKEIQASGTVTYEHIDIGLRKCWNELVDKIQHGSTPRQRSLVVAKDSLEMEADVLHRHARWLYDAYYYQEAGKVMDACLVIGSRTKERVKLALMIQGQRTFNVAGKRYLQRSPNIEQLSAYDPEYSTYGRLGMYANMYHANARAVTHEFRSSVLEQSEVFIHMGELAKERLRMNIQLDGAYGWANNTEYDRDMEQTLYPFVTHALGELLFCVTVLDHSMVKFSFDGKKAYDEINSQIEELTILYLDNLEKLQSREKVNASSVKLKTVEYLLSRDYKYYQSKHPELFKRMLNIASIALKTDKDDIISMIKPMFDLSAYKALSHKELAENEASEIWVAFMLETISIGKEKGVKLLNTNPLYLQKNREERIEWLKFLCNQSISTRNNTRSEIAIGNHPIGDLIGMDMRSQRMITTVMAKSCLIEDLDGLNNTTEYLRAAGFYRMINHLKEQDQESLRLFLQNRGEITKNQDRYKYAQDWSPQVWSRIKSVLKASRKLNPDVIKLLDRLSKGEIEDVVGDQKIKLTNQGLISMPNQHGYQDRIFYSIPERAGIHDGELWLPGSYFKYRLPRGTLSNENDLAIQVVSLSDKSVKTIILPRRVINMDRGENSLHIDSRSEAGRILFTNQYAYYTPNGQVLFCISRDNYEVTEVGVPSGFDYLSMRLLDAHHDMDMILVAAEDGDSQKNHREAWLVEGNKIVKVLASNRRKPSAGPMDKIGFHYTLEFMEDTAWVSCEYSYTAHAYDLKTEKWSKISKDELPMIKYRRIVKMEYDHNVDSGNDHCAYFKCAPRGMFVGFWGHGWVMPPLYSLRLREVFDEYMWGEIPVSMEPVDHPNFKSEWFPRVPSKGDSTDKASPLWTEWPYLGSTEGWWISANEAVAEGMYEAVIIGKEGQNFIFGLMAVNLNENGMPNYRYNHRHGLSGIWMVPEEEVMEALKPHKDRYSRLVSFKHGWTQENLKEKVDIVFISPKNDFKWFSRKPIEMVGGGSIMGIKPKLDINNMQLVMGISRKDYAKKLNCRIEIGSRDNPTIIFDSKDHELGTATKHYKSAIYTSLPDGVEEIRLINDSPKNTSLLLHQILFIDKNTEPD